MKIRLLLIALIVVLSSFGTIVNAHDTQTLVCVDEGNRLVIFADGSVYKLVDRDCNKLCPRGFPASCTILQHLAMSSDPACPCCEIINSVTKEKVFAVRVKNADSPSLSENRR
jgi:hypothetical protein